MHHLIRNIEQPYKWALMGRPPLRKWSEGRVVLLGDAAHPTLPFLAQGAAMAIEDGFMVGRAVELMCHDIPTALRRFEDARVQRCAEIVQHSSEQARRFHNPELADARGAAAYVGREWSEARIKERYDWLFKYQVDRVPL